MPLVLMFVAHSMGNEGQWYRVSHRGGGIPLLASRCDSTPLPYPPTYHMVRAPALALRSVAQQRRTGQQQRATGQWGTSQCCPQKVACSAAAPLTTQPNEVPSPSIRLVLQEVHLLVSRSPASSQNAPRRGSARPRGLSSTAGQETTAHRTAATADVFAGANYQSGSLSELERALEGCPVRLSRPYAQAASHTTSSKEQREGCWSVTWHVPCVARVGIQPSVRRLLTLLDLFPRFLHQQRVRLRTAEPPHAPPPCKSR